MTRAHGRFPVACATVMLTMSCAQAGKDSAPTDTRTDRAEVVIPATQQSGYIETEIIRPTPVAEFVRASGRIVIPDNRRWQIGAITSGRIERVLVSEGDRVAAGQLLATMHSHDVHEAKADYLTAVAEHARLEAAAALARKSYERMNRLYALKAASLEATEVAEQQWLEAQTALRASALAVEREQAHLEDNLGIQVSESSTDMAELISIRARAAGYVLQKNITPGAVVGASTDLFVIGELSHLWLIASVREEYLERIHGGETATVLVKGLPGLSLPGLVTNVGEQFDPTTHAMRVRVDFDNPGNRLRPEMLAEASIAVGKDRLALLVPGEAVQQIDGQDVLFVRAGAERFLVRPVTVGKPVGDRTPVLDGLKAGEAVVTRGAFVVKSEVLKSTMRGE